VPLPPWVPPVQVMVPVTVTLSEPLRVPPLTCGRLSDKGSMAAIGPIATHTQDLHPCDSTEGSKYAAHCKYLVFLGRKGPRYKLAFDGH
jgi:hypothetical protein